MNRNEPDFVGVPEIVPSESRVSPAGSLPEVMLNAGAGVPDASSCNEYSFPTVPGVSEDVVIFGADQSEGLVIFTVNCFVEFPAEF